MTEINLGLFQEGGPDFDERKVNSPVFILNDGFKDRFAVAGALVKNRDELQINGMEFEVTEEGGVGCLLGAITLQQLQDGCIEVRGNQKWTVKFDGLASDEKHKHRKWSYWD